jgi:peroxiredoxin
LRFLRAGRLTAPEIAPPDWAGDAAMLGPLRGRVILLDFFSYGDPAGVRSLQRVRDLGDHYRAAGLVVIGVHVPAWSFEQRPEDARREIWRLGVPYPVALDADLKLFRAYGLRDLPARVLVDATGRIRAWTEGPGEYEALERAIRTLLREAHDGKDPGPPHEPLDDLPRAGTLRYLPSPEIRFGQLGVGFGPPEPDEADGDEKPAPAPASPREFEMPELRVEGRAYLDGAWSLAPDGIASADGSGGVAVVYEGASVQIVVSPAEDEDSRLEVTLDGKPVDPEVSGADLEDGGDGATVLDVDRGRLYDLISCPEFGIHNLDLRIHGAGTRVHLLSFGTRDVPEAS